MFLVQIKELYLSPANDFLLKFPKKGKPMKILAAIIQFRYD